MATDRILLRYAALARRAERLLAAPAPGNGPVPTEVLTLLDDTTYRLGLYVSAMPGSRAPAPAEFEALSREVDDALSHEALSHDVDDAPSRDAGAAL